MKKLSLAVGLLAMALSLTACKSRSIVGKWTSDTSLVPGVSTTIDFKADKTAAFNMKGNVQGIDMNANFKANYDLQGEKLSVTMTEVDLGSIAMMLPPGTVDTIKSEMGNRNTGTLQWNDDNKITIVTADGQSTVYSRAK